MRNIILLSALLTACYAVTPTAEAYNVSLRICEYVQANDKTRLRSYLKQNKLKLRTIYRDIKCNDNSLLIFASKKNALSVGEFIISKLPSKKVALEIDEMANFSAHLAEKARQRVK